MTLLGAATACEEDRQQFIERIESHLALPDGAHPLEDYRRIYGFEVEAGKVSALGQVQGFLYIPRDGSARVALWAEQPINFAIGGGGCDVVRISYDTVTDRVSEAYCNGTI